MTLSEDVSRGYFFSVYMTIVTDHCFARLLSISSPQESSLKMQCVSAVNCSDCCHACVHLGACLVPATLQCTASRNNCTTDR